MGRGSRSSSSSDDRSDLYFLALRLPLYGRRRDAAEFTGLLIGRRPKATVTRRQHTADGIYRDQGRHDQAVILDPGGTAEPALQPARRSAIAGPGIAKRKRRRPQDRKSTRLNSSH